ncbi:MAG: hypothetical protein JNK82_41450, partial [Myxococcaceae bacterium]|nr:hypothetical protein [Myxococcaceae bacterium]
PPRDKGEQISAALKLDPDNALALEEQAHAERRPPQKLALARALTARRPTAVGYRLLAQALGRKAEQRPARIAALEQAVALDAALVPALVDLSDALRVDGQRDRALELSTRAAELAPYDPRAAWSNAESLAKLNRCPEAVAAGRRALELLGHGSKGLARVLTARVKGWEQGCSEQRAPQDDHRDGEVDDQPGDVDDRGDEGR